MDLRPGIILAKKLKLLRPLGEGGMGVVWAARHLTLDTDVAVKFIRPERVAKDPVLVTRFEREARATARIAHPNVVRIMDYGSVDDTGYIVMELLYGFTLADLLLRGGRLSLGTTTALVAQIGDALEAAHGRGIVHRDIKPQNVFITEWRRGFPFSVKVLDFGVAKMLGTPEVQSVSTVLTETGVVIGSVPYMSPEQLEGRKDVDLQSDLWSLGIVVYESLTGQRPFQGGSIVTVGAAVLKGEYPRATELRNNLPAWVDDWLAKALSVDPKKRFGSAQEMIAAFGRQDRPTLEIEGPPGEPPVDVEEASRLLVRSQLFLEPPQTTEPRALPDPTPDTLALPPGGKTASHPPVQEKPSSGRSLVPIWHRLRRVALIGVAALGSGLVITALVAHDPTVAAKGCPSGMRLIRGATFVMGSPADADTPSDETVREGVTNHVTVRSFCLDTTEVTVRDYLACKSCARPRLTVEFEGLTPKGQDFESRFCNTVDTKDHPMNCVDWYEAKVYCTSVGKRLPTEAEWEFAARGLSARSFPWGEATPSAERVNACGVECSLLLSARLEKVGKGPWPAMYDGDDGAPATAKVGHYPAGATPEGVLDLGGNVWEWTDSGYCPYPYDERGSCGDSRRVLRGGGWDTTEIQDLRTARRYPSTPSARGKSIGFRCATGP